jgi:hypothetical protein
MTPFFIFLIRPKASSYQRPSTKSTLWVPKKKEVDDADADESWTGQLE